MDGAPVTVAAGLRNSLAADEKAWSLYETVREGHDESVIGSARIAHSREATMQRTVQGNRCILAQQRPRHAIEDLHI